MPRPPNWPPVIHMLAREVVEVAKARGLHGRVTIRQTAAGDYVVALVIPAAETVPVRPSTK